MSTLAEADKAILPKDAVPSTGGNTAAYETAYNESTTIKGGKKRKSARKIGKKAAKKRSTRKVSWLKFPMGFFKSMGKKCKV